MVRRTITVIDVEECVRPRREQIKKRVRMERSIALGINLGIMAITAVIMVVGVITAWNVLMARTGYPGGEIFVIPAIGFAFCWGHQIGRCTEGADYDEYREIDD